MDKTFTHISICLKFCYLEVVAFKVRIWSSKELHGSTVLVLFVYVFGHNQKQCCMLRWERLVINSNKEMFFIDVNQTRPYSTPFKWWVLYNNNISRPPSLLKVVVNKVWSLIIQLIHSLKKKDINGLSVSYSFIRNPQKLKKSSWSFEHGGISLLAVW